jgi:hypothetical protein
LLAPLAADRALEPPTSSSLENKKGVPSLLLSTAARSPGLVARSAFDCALCSLKIALCLLLCAAAIHVSEVERFAERRSSRLGAEMRAHVAAPAGPHLLRKARIVQQRTEPLRELLMIM